MNKRCRQRAARGYFGVALYNPKTGFNIGTAMRSASVLNADFLMVFGRRYRWQASDTVKAFKHVPLFEYDCSEDLWKHLPKDCQPIAVEINDKAKNLLDFKHPERAVYILGPEDGSLPAFVTKRAAAVVQIPSWHCLNLGAAATTVLYDRLLKQHIAEKASLVSA